MERAQKRILLNPKSFLFLEYDHKAVQYLVYLEIPNRIPPLSVSYCSSATSAHIHIYVQICSLQTTSVLLSISLFKFASNLNLQHQYIRQLPIFIRPHEYFLFLWFFPISRVLNIRTCMAL